jgi:hypothetical protein
VQPWTFRRRQAREAASLLFRGVRLFRLRRRLNRFAPVHPPQSPRLHLAVLSARAAAVPTDQALLK